MLHRRYSHGHSAGLGFLLALALYQHALVFALLTFTAGLLAGRTWAVWTEVARQLRRRFAPSSTVKARGTVVR
jgi:hypothetical protein